MPLDEQVENIYNNSSLSTETYELDDDGNLIKYKSNLFEKKDGKYYCINGEKSNIINIPEYAGVNTICDYLQNWLELYNLGKEENISKKIAPGYLESNIYNKNKDELTYLLTVNDILSRTIIIRRNSSNSIPDYFGAINDNQLSDTLYIEYRDSVGYAYFIKFTYNKSTKRIGEIIEKEAQYLKGYDNIFLGGFSQGACMSIHIGLSYEKTMGGIICVSGALFPNTLINKKNEKVPIFISHGDLDDQITKDIQQLSIKKIKHFPNLEEHYYPSIGHYIEDNTLADLTKFFHKYMK
jgi:hypothetical protein